MPLTRPITCEEDITMSLSTVISGLVTKYNASGAVDARVLLGSIAANTLLGINELIDSSSLSLTDKAKFREELRELSRRALRPSLGIMDGNGNSINAAAIDPNPKQ
jgi:hypothetical protein